MTTSSRCSITPLTYVWEGRNTVSMYTIHHVHEYTTLVDIICLLMFVYVWVGLGFFLSLLTSSYDAINMFFHVKVTSPFCGFCHKLKNKQNSLSLSRDQRELASFLLHVPYNAKLRNKGSR